MRSHAFQPHKHHFPRITPEQVADLEARIHRVAATIFMQPMVLTYFVPRVLAQVKARSLDRMTRPQYRAACVLLDDDLAAARKLVRSLKPALRAWEQIGIPVHMGVNMVTEVPARGEPWQFDGQPFEPPAIPLR